MPPHRLGRTRVLSSVERYSVKARFGADPPQLEATRRGAAQVPGRPRVQHGQSVEGCRLSLPSVLRTGLKLKEETIPSELAAGVIPARPVLPLRVRNSRRADRPQAFCPRAPRKSSGGHCDKRWCRSGPVLLVATTGAREHGKHETSCAGCYPTVAGVTSPKSAASSPPRLPARPDQREAGVGHDD
jgi:hypothetical protein